MYSLLMVQFDACHLLYALSYSAQLGYIFLTFVIKKVILERRTCQLVNCLWIYYILLIKCIFCVLYGIVSSSINSLICILHLAIATLPPLVLVMGDLIIFRKKTSTKKSLNVSFFHTFMSKLLLRPLTFHINHDGDESVHTVGDTEFVTYIRSRQVRQYLSVRTMHPGRGKSVVWKHFSSISSNEAKCNICGKSVKVSGGTSNLRSHLKKWHNSVFTADNKTKPDDTTDDTEVS